MLREFLTLVEFDTISSRMWYDSGLYSTSIVRIAHCSMLFASLVSHVTKGFNEGNYETQDSSSLRTALRRMIRSNRCPLAFVLLALG